MADATNVAASLASELTAGEAQRKSDDRLYRATRALADCIAEFGMGSGCCGERLQELYTALEPYE